MKRERTKRRNPVAHAMKKMRLPGEPHKQRKKEEKSRGGAKEPLHWALSDWE